MNNEEHYTQTELSIKCKVPRTTLRDRLDRYNKHIAKLDINGRIYYTKETYHQMIVLKKLLRDNCSVSDIKMELMRVTLHYQYEQKLKEIEEDVTT